jgi:hypothetical protein
MRKRLSVLAPETGRNHFDRLFNRYDRPRELKLVSLKLPGNEDYEYVLKFSSMSVNETAMQNIQAVHKSLCDETDVL